MFSRLAASLGPESEPAYRAAFLITAAFVLLAWPSIGPLSRPPRPGHDAP
jgi:hypothetical protein